MVLAYEVRRNRRRAADDRLHRVAEHVALELARQIQRHLRQRRNDDPHSRTEHGDLAEHVLVVAADVQCASGVKARHQVANQSEYVRQRQYEEIPLFEDLFDAVAAVLGSGHDRAVTEQRALASAGGAAREHDDARILRRRLDRIRGLALRVDAEQCNGHRIGQLGF